jgi:phage terminase large subunit GpA-like protein
MRRAAPKRKAKPKPRRSANSKTFSNLPTAGRKLSLAQWIEATIILPDVVADPGPIRLAPPMKAIADAIGDPAIERVSVLKSARVGFSTFADRDDRLPRGP